jgi:hypothetical protein
MVVVSLDRPTPPTFPPSDTVVRQGEVRQVTLDARDAERWIYLDFEGDSVVADPGHGDWDLAVRRFNVILNGGSEFEGDAAAVDLGDRPIRSVGRVPREGLVGTGRNGGEPRHPLLADWYRYDFFSHLLLARSRTYAVRTAEGGGVALRFLSYYCPGPEAGCVTLAYRPLGPGGEAGGGP